MLIDTLHDRAAYSTTVALAAANANEDVESRSELAQGKVDVMPIRVGAVPSKTKISSDPCCSKSTVHQHSSAVAEIEDEIAVALVEVAEREAALKAHEVTEMTVEEDITVEVSDEACNGSYQELVAGKAPCIGNARGSRLIKILLCLTFVACAMLADGFCHQIWPRSSYRP